jgi:hypothetical protein
VFLQLIQKEVRGKAVEVEELSSEEDDDVGDEEKGGIMEIPRRALPTQELKKPQNRAPLLTDLGGESQPKEP